MSGTPVEFGVDVLLREGRRCLMGGAGWRRVGLVTNDAARLAADPARRSRDALRQADIPLVRLFGPEHGLQAIAADGAAVQDGTDPLTALPVVSLYGARMRPDARHLADLDAVLFDIPDVGARFYTYAWTLWHTLHACAEANVPLVVLDRPNPLGGLDGSAEGPLVEPACRSFIGEDDIPIRHALTLGELVRLWQREHVPASRLEVVPCQHWDVTRAWPATGCAWVPTSPAMPIWASTIWYPGTCLFEATNLSVGRGTEAPFTMIGAPWLDAGSVANALADVAARMSAVVEPTVFVPTQAPYADLTCQGLRLRLANGVDIASREAASREAAELVARRLRPVTLGLELLAAIAQRHPAEFAWARYPTAANPQGDDHLARLVGRQDATQCITTWSTAPHRDQIAQYTQLTDWTARIAPIRLYSSGSCSCT